MDMFSCLLLMHLFLFQSLDFLAKQNVYLKKRCLAKTILYTRGRSGR